METISTSSPEKLPEAVRGLLDETRPLPPGVMFYEERFTTAIAVKNAVWGLGLLAAGILLLPLGLYELFAPQNDRTVSDTHSVEWWIIGVGFVMGFVGWTMLNTVPLCLTVRRRQVAGERTRYGLFLTPEALVYRNYADTTVIPPENLRGLEGSKVKYEGGGGRPGVKSFGLSKSWVSSEWPEVERAIRAWSPPSTPTGLAGPLATSVDRNNGLHGGK